MTKKLDYAVFIGRFQPFHIGHYQVVQEALMRAEHVILVIGSHNKSPDIKNPIPTVTRRKLIDAHFTSSELARISFHYQVDHTYNMTRWLTEIQSAVFSIAQKHAGGWTDRPVRPRIGIIGFSKDHTSFYLQKFPQWESIEVVPETNLSATDIRTGYYSTGSVFVRHMLNSHVLSMTEIALHQHDLSEEWEFIREHNEDWSESPYPPIFSTTDALVTQAGHILVVKRGVNPGIGQIALPGGYVEPHLNLAQNTIKELREETKLKVPEPVLTGSIKGVRMFDDPNRSTRGRIITQVTHFSLNDEYEMPKVAGGDDAKDAWFMPISQFIALRERTFEDHHCIVSAMLGV